jgi:hypothetical protein
VSQYHLTRGKMVKAVMVRRHLYNCDLFDNVESLFVLLDEREESGHGPQSISCLVFLQLLLQYDGVTLGLKCACLPSAGQSQEPLYCSTHVKSMCRLCPLILYIVLYWHSLADIWLCAHFTAACNYKKVTDQLPCHPDPEQTCRSQCAEVWELVDFGELPDRHSQRTNAKQEVVSLFCRHGKPV